MSSKLVLIEEYHNANQADLAKVQLEAEGVLVVLDNQHIVKMDFLMANAVGNIRLLVPIDQAEQAREILGVIDSYRRERQANPDQGHDLSCFECGQPMAEHERFCSHCGWTYALEE